MRFHPDVLRCHEQFGGDLEDMQYRYDIAAALAAEAALSEMRAELERVKDYHRNCSDEAQRLLAEKHDILAEQARLRKALEPFANWSKQMDTFYAYHPDSVVAAGNHGIYVTFGHLRAAARALASQDEGEER